MRQQRKTSSRETRENDSLPESGVRRLGSFALKTLYIRVAVNTRKKILNTFRGSTRDDVFINKRILRVCQGQQEKTANLGRYEIKPQRACGSR